MKQTNSSLARLALKIAITIGLMAYLLSKVDVAPVVVQMRAMSPKWAAAAVLPMVLQLALVSLRWRLVNGLVGANMQLAQVFRLTLIGQFFNQVLPTALGGDAMRAWLASREGVPLARAISGVLCDRALGLMVLAVIVAGTLLLLPQPVAERLPAKAAFQAIALLGVCGLVALFFAGDFIARLLGRRRVTESLGKLVQDLRCVVYSRGPSVAIVALSGAVQVLFVTTIYLCAQGMSIPLGFGAALLVIPAIMLVSVIPISFAGWGVREGAMIIGLSLLGIGAPQALAISVAFGLLNIVVGLPGGCLWLLGSAPARASFVRSAE
jgi:uncharacterized protein (TIRG00374 family)